MNPTFIFMLTHNDVTVADARARVRELGDAGVEVIGFKDIGLPVEELKLLSDDIRKSGRKVALEVVSLDPDTELESAAAAVGLDVDYLLGGTCPEGVLPLIADTRIRYFPFCGQIEGHPSKLMGDANAIAHDAARLTAMNGVDGVDLLAYRWHGGDVPGMVSSVIDAARGKVIAAGSIDRVERVRDLAKAGVSAFTVGTAAFSNRFPAIGSGLRAQVDSILQIGLEGEFAVSKTMIENAAGRIVHQVRETPVVRADGLFEQQGGNVFLKLESLQHSGSFKARGAFNTLLSMDVPPVGVVAASGGNHGAAVAYACRKLGISAEVFVPEISSPTKLDRLREYGATVHVVPGTFANALEACNERQEQTGASSIHAYDALSVVAGQGTTGREISKQIGNVDTVLVAVGGGGLIGGISSWFRGDVKVVGVEPLSCRSMAAALEAGEPVDVDVGGLAADSLGARKVGNIAYDAARRFVDQVVTLQDADIRAAQLFLWNEYRVVAEPAGAAALAPLLTGAYVPEAGENVCVLVCGGNTDLATLSAA